MAPVTGTIPKTKVRNNCNVPQEAVTPTRRDMSSNLVTTSLDWVPVSEYNSRTNYNQSRKPTNNTSDHEYADLDNASSFETGFGRFVPVRPQPRVLPLNVQQRETISAEHIDENSRHSSSYSLHPYPHPIPNGIGPQLNHSAAAVMIVNPTTPNAVSINMSQPFNTTGNSNRKNLIRNLNTARNNFEGSSNNNTSSNNSTSSNSRTGTKTVNLINNMYDPAGSSNTIIDSSQVHHESARALGEAIVAACPDATAVERRLGQIREYIRVTSSLVDTMRNSEDEDVVIRPVSSQSIGSGYSENELWQNEIKNKMEISQQRLAALKQQQKRLLKYRAEAKQQLAEINHARQLQEIQAATAHDNLGNIQNQSFGNNCQQSNRMYAANQIGVATTLPHSGDINHHQGAGASQNVSTDSLVTNNREHNGSNPSGSHHEERYSHRDTNIANSEGADARDSDVEDNEALLTERGHQLTIKLHELRAKKQHMENLVNEFQKLQRATHMAGSHNMYSSSGEDSVDEEPTHLLDKSMKCNKADTNIKNDDPFKLMEIKAIKTALQKTKDLMRSVENYETEQLSEMHEDNFQMPNISNINDNKSEGGGSTSGWSNEDSVTRVRNSLPQRHKFTNEHHSQQQNHEMNIASLQELAQQLRMETEKIMEERARLKQVVSNKEYTRKQKKVNEEVRPSTSGVPGPVECRQRELRALLAEKQKQLEALLNKEKILCAESEEQKTKSNSRPTSAINQSYNSEQEELDSQSQQIIMDAQNAASAENYRVNGDNLFVERAQQNTMPAHVASNYASDSDGAMRNKSNQRNRGRRRPPQDRQFEESFDNIMSPTINTNQNVMRNEHRGEPAPPNVVTPLPGDGGSSSTLYQNVPQPSWTNHKMNQDIRTNQFTQNSHSQTMDRLLSTPQVSYPPSMPFSMMMPYGMVAGCACACGCSLWATWCWQQLVLQQRELHQLRDQLNHLEERWRAENVSHTLNNQVPPGNRANNYWDNFRSYSRQNLLSSNSKTNADGHLGVGLAHNPHPLVERSHNALHPAVTSAPNPANTPKRNTDGPPSLTANNTLDDARHSRRNIAYERSLSFSSAPDVLNVNQNSDQEPGAASAPPANRHSEDTLAPNINLNRQEAFNPFRNINISNTIPEIIQSHANNLNSSSNSFNTKKKSSSKLPAKNSANRRLANCSLDYAQTSNINIASTSEAHNPNLASTSHEVNDKATSKLFDLLRENVYTEVTAFIGVNESHPDFLIQLFRELQLISSDSLRQKVLQSIRSVLSRYSHIASNQNNENYPSEISRVESMPAGTNEASNSQEHPYAIQNGCVNGAIDSNIVRFLMNKSEETCTIDVLETLASLVINNSADDGQTKKQLMQFLSKYEGARLRDVSSDIIDNLSEIMTESGDGDESSRQPTEGVEASMLQDVAGSLSLFASGEGQLHSCPYELWPTHVHVEMESAEAADARDRSAQEAAVDLINCTEMHNGELAEADQTCRGEGNSEGGADALPDLVEAEEATPAEAEAEWLGLDRVPTRLHMEESSENQKGNINTK